MAPANQVSEFSSRAEHKDRTEILYSLLSGNSAKVESAGYGQIIQIVKSFEIWDQRAFLVQMHRSRFRAATRVTFPGRNRLNRLNRLNRSQPKTKCSDQKCSNPDRNRLNRILSLVEDLIAANKIQ